MERFSAEGEPGGEDCPMPAGADSKSEANDRSRNEGRGDQRLGEAVAFLGIKAAATESEAQLIALPTWRA
jgi:hypothetical protein